MKTKPIIQFFALLLAIVMLAATGLSAVVFTWYTHLDSSEDPEWVDTQIDGHLRDLAQLLVNQYVQKRNFPGMTETRFLEFIDASDAVNRAEVSAVVENNAFTAPYFTGWNLPAGYSYLQRAAGENGAQVGSLSHAAGTKSWRCQQMTGTYYQVVSVSQMQADDELVASKGAQRLVRCTQDNITVSLEVSAAAYQRLVEQYTPTPSAPMRVVLQVGSHLPWVLAGSLALFFLLLIPLGMTAGYDRRGVPALRGLNRLPLDLFLAAALASCWLGVHLIRQYLAAESENAVLWTAVAVVLALVSAVLPVYWLRACFAQGKAARLEWVNRCALVQFVRWLARRIAELYAMLPQIARWLLLSAGITALLFFGVRDLYLKQRHGLLVIGLCVIAAVTVYGGWAFGRLARGVKNMQAGNLSDPINTRFLPPVFRDCGNRINALADSAMTAAQEQMRAERMKTELITNVSHDIKTPLTSIMSYAELLQQPHTPEQEAQYLAVMTKQVMRMKKLVEDLTQMSKAATGNVQVALAELDAVEAVNQALGEFSDKLNDTGLTLVYSHPDEPLRMVADGELTWRVLSNLLSNAAKYAMPGTRVYVRVCEQGGQVQIAIKNISREPLNISSDELMERFVRGDASRHTEGSGLGLNIAKSLMELQNGALELAVDGDLFKATVIFPAF